MSGGGRAALVVAAAALVCAWISAALAQIPAPLAGALVFEVANVRDDAGHVRVDVCTRETFLKAECPYSGEAIAQKGVTEVRVEGVPPGVYAAQIYHDRNDNHAVDRTATFGIPLEEVGFSNNAFIGLTGPSFARAAFTHDIADQPLSVRLKRYK